MLVDKARDLDVWNSWSVNSGEISISDIDSYGKPQSGLRKRVYLGGKCPAGDDAPLRCCL